MLASEVNSLNALICLALGLPSNLLLIWLIVRRTPKELRPYSRILFQTCFTDLAFLFAFVLIQPFFISKDGWTFVYFNSSLINQIDSSRIQSLFLFLYMVINNMGSSVMAVQFLYRYLILIKNMQISLGKYLLLLAIPSSLRSVVTIYSLSECFDHVDSLTDPNILKLLSADSGSPIRVLVLSNTNFARKLAGYTLLLLYVANLIVMAFTSWAMVKHVREHMKKMQRNLLATAELDKQMTKNLIIWSILPICIFINNTVNNMNSLFVDTYWLNLYQMLSFLPICWPSTINPLVTVLTIRPYRNAIRALALTPVGNSSRVVALTTANNSNRVV